MTGGVADGSNEDFNEVKVELGYPPVGKMLGCLDEKPVGSSKLFVGFGLPGAVPTTGTAMVELDARSARSTALIGVSMITGWLGNFLASGLKDLLNESGI